MENFKFTIEKKLKGALGRAGEFLTPHGVIHTPAFVTVATKATAKSLNSDQIRDTGAEVVLGNTYHLLLQPGDEIVAKAGGMGEFMNWRRSDGQIAPTMTDSGGFQVFSLGAAFGKDISKVLKPVDTSLLRFSIILVRMLYLPLMNVLHRQRTGSIRKKRWSEHIAGRRDV